MTENLQNIKLNALPVCNNRYIKTKKEKKMKIKFILIFLVYMCRKIA